jgi:hypothetical protein
MFLIFFIFLGRKMCICLWYMSQAKDEKLRAQVFLLLSILFVYAFHSTFFHRISFYFILHNLFFSLFSHIFCCCLVMFSSFLFWVIRGIINVYAEGFDVRL